MQFTENLKMADLIHQNYLLLPVLNRFDIQLGFGDLSIREICNNHGINTDFFLLIINSFHDHDYFPEKQLLSFPPGLIIDYIRKSHVYYLDHKVPQIEELIGKLIRHAESSRQREFALIEKFFRAYKVELVEHIEDEENRVFPHVIAITEAYTSGKIEESHIRAIKENPIKKYEEGHTNIEDKLYDLKNIIIKYLPPIEDYTLSNTLLIELFRLERDLNDHARIENKILVPKVHFIEKEILKHEK